jgi:hypothetical protein
VSIDLRRNENNLIIGSRMTVRLSKDYLNHLKSFNSSEAARNEQMLSENEVNLNLGREKEIDVID